MPNDSAPPPAAVADEVEKARRLLEELFGEASGDDGPHAIHACATGMPSVRRRKRCKF